VGIKEGKSAFFFSAKSLCKKTLCKKILQQKKTLLIPEKDCSVVEVIGRREMLRSRTIEV